MELRGDGRRHRVKVAQRVVPQVVLQRVAQRGHGELRRLVRRLANERKALLDGCRQAACARRQGKTRMRGGRVKVVGWQPRTRRLRSQQAKHRSKFDELRQEHGNRRQIRRLKGARVGGDEDERRVLEDDEPEA